MRPLVMWTIYDHPIDHPNHFIARKWEIYATKLVATAETLKSEDLQSLRDDLSDQGLIVIYRSPGDDPVILETWL